MIETHYDFEADVFYVRFAAPDAEYDESAEVAANITVDFDKQNRPMAIEIIHARWMIEGWSNAPKQEKPNAAQ